MSRNASGTYTLPIAAFVAGGVIRASDHNSNYSDIATALTQSLATTGVSTMTGPIKAAAGTAAAPSITFGGAPTSGFYLAGVNQIGWSASGAAAATFNSDGTANFLNAVTFAGAVTVAGGPVTSFPSGTVMIFGQTAAPLNWTKLVDQNDTALRVVSGTASSGGTVAFSTLFDAAITNLAAHTHTGTTSSDGGHTHTVPYALQALNGGGAILHTIDGASTIDTGSAGAHSHTLTNDSAGSGGTTTFAVKYVDVIRASKD